MTAAPTTYVQVLLPLRLGWIPTYSSPVPLEAGQRVRAELGRRSYDGVVWRRIDRPDLPPERIQPVAAVQDELPRVTAEELRFWQFLSDYYLCTLGEVYKAAYPLLKIRSEQTSADILARLRTRLVRKEQGLAGRHNERVTARLQAAREALLTQIRAIERSREDGGAAEAVRPEGGSPGPAEVLIGTERIGSYREALRDVLSAGRQALVLCPETAFCDRLEQVLQEEFGDRLRVFHSGKTAAARRRAAEDLRSAAPVIVLGTRSALFLPFRALALVIVDEEQDPAYKQGEPAPRYQGRDAAVALAGIHGARVLLGAAVPSLETLLNVRLGKYVLRQDGAPPAGAEIIDIPAERRKNGMVGSFSRRLIAAVAQTDGPVVLIRGWEKPEVLQEEAARLFPGREIRILTLGALKREGAAGAALLAVMQADALIARDDFRGDERALQILGTIGLFAPRVLVQTAVPARFSGRRTLYELLDERREFGFPPYTRLVEVRRRGGGEVVERHFLARDRQLAERKAAIAASLPAGCYPDVDPAD